jgi:Fe2+ transport system protein B
MMEQQNHFKENIEINKLAYEGTNNIRQNERRFSFSIFSQIRVESSNLKKDRRVTHATTHRFLFVFLFFFFFFFFFCGVGEGQVRLQETKKYQFSEKKNNNNQKIKKEAMEDCFVLGRTLKPKCVVVVVKIVCVWEPSALPGRVNGAQDR